MRFLLGIAEGGVFPATIVLLANWFAPAERARANAYWMLCQPVAIVISSPLSGWILGRWNWRVLLIAEGILPFLWLMVWIVTIDDHPATASGLILEGDKYLRKALDPPSGGAAKASGSAVLRSLADRQVLMLVALYFFLNCGGYGYLFWLPSALAAMKKLSSLSLGVLFSVPYLAAGVVMALNSHHSDRLQERRFHVALPLLLAGFLLLASVLTSAPVPLISFVLVCLAGASFYGSLGPLWAIPTESLPRHVVGSAAGLVNAIGNLGGYFGPVAVGALRERFGDFRIAFVALSVSLALAGTLALLLKSGCSMVSAHVSGNRRGRH